MSSLEPQNPLEALRSGPGSGPIRLLAAAAADSDGLEMPAAVVIGEEGVIAVGSPAGVGPVRGPDLDLGDVLLTPALVNAHVHLDLTDVGPIPLEEGFDRWLAEVRERRPHDEAAVAAAVATGVEASLAGGVVAVGDIAGAMGWTAARSLAASDLAGISFVEVFGIGRREADGLEAVADLEERIATLGSIRPGFRIGLSPHAPYSCGRAVYEAAARSGLPVATHLCESPEEIEFVGRGQGPFVDLLRTIGALGPDGDVLQGIGVPASGVHPIELLADTTPSHPWVLAHLNYPAEPEEEAAALAARLDILRRLDATVVYCPRAYRFLGHPRAGRDPHPWRQLAEAGVNVALGTDGAPCLESAERLSTLDEIRLLLAEGGSLPDGLAMATTQGARALGLDPGPVTFRGGATAGLLATPVPGARGMATATELAEALSKGDGGPEWVLPPRPSRMQPAAAG